MGGKPETAYTLRINAAGIFVLLRVNTVKRIVTIFVDLMLSLSTSKPFSYVFNNLHTDKTYYVRISAFNEKGEGPCSEVMKIVLKSRTL